MKWTLVAVALLVVLLGVGGLPGQTKPFRDMSDVEKEAFFKEEKLKVLNGLPGVSVNASWKSAHPSEGNDRLQAAVELRLRNNGVRVFATTDEWKSSPGRPMLTCCVVYYTIGSVLVARTIVQVEEQVVSVRTSETLLMKTWENTLPGQKLVEKESFEEAREWLFEAVDEFCNAYRAMNPKAVP